MNRRGAVLIIFLFAWAAFFLFTMEFVAYARRAMERQHKQTIADMAVLTSLRLRAKALRTIAARWENEVGAKLHDPAAAQLAADRLAGVLGSYKGRITAGTTVVTQAHGISKTRLIVRDAAARELDIDPAGFYLDVPGGAPVWIENGFLKRLWRPDRQQAHPDGLLIYDIDGVLSSGRLRWDTDPRRSEGNGGYPRDWPAAQNAGRTEPFRYPLFRAELIHHD